MSPFYKLDVAVVPSFKLMYSRTHSVNWELHIKENIAKISGKSRRQLYFYGISERINEGRKIYFNLHKKVTCLNILVKQDIS